MSYYLKKKHTHQLSKAGYIRVKGTIPKNVPQETCNSWCFSLAVRLPPIWCLIPPTPQRKNVLLQLCAVQLLRGIQENLSLMYVHEHGACLGKHFCKSNVYHILLMALYCRSMNLDRSISILKYHIMKCCESDEKHVAAYVWIYPWYTTKPPLQIPSTNPTQSSASCLSL